MVDLPPSAANYGDSENSTPDEPLGLKHPLQPAQPLGINRQFLVPLGARSLSVLDLSIFQPDVIQADFLENPFLDSPFFVPEVPVSSSFPIELPSHSNAIQRQQSPQASVGGSNERSPMPTPTTPSQSPQPQPTSSGQLLELAVFADQPSNTEAILNLQADQTIANLTPEAVELETIPEQTEPLQHKQTESYPGGQIESLEQPRSESLVSEQDVSINRSTFAQINDTSTKLSETPISNQQNSDLQRYVESENNQNLSLPLGLVQVSENQANDAISAQSEVIQAQSVELQSDGRSLDTGLSIHSQAKSIDESQVYPQTDAISQPLAESQAEVQLSSNPQLQRQDQVESSDLESVQLQQKSEINTNSQILKNSQISELTQPTASTSFAQRQVNDSNVSPDSQAINSSIQSDSESEISASIPSDHVKFQSNSLSDLQIQTATELDPSQVRSDSQNSIEIPSQSIANSVAFQVDQPNQTGISSHSNSETEVQSKQQNQASISSQPGSETQVESELPNDASSLPNFVTSIDSAASISIQAQSESQAASDSNLLVSPSSPSQIHSQPSASEPSQISHQAQVNPVVSEPLAAQTDLPIQPTAETKTSDAPIESEAIALKPTNISAINPIPSSLNLKAQAKSESDDLLSQFDVEAKAHSDQTSESAFIRSQQELQTGGDTNIQADLKQNQPISSQSDAWIQAQINTDVNDIQPLSQSDTQAQVNSAIQTTQNLSPSNPWVQSQIDSSQIDSIEATQSPSQLEHQIQPKSNLDNQNTQFESQSHPQVQHQIDFFPQTIQTGSESDPQFQAPVGSDAPLNSPGNFLNPKGLTTNSDALPNPFESQNNPPEIAQAQLNSESFSSDAVVSSSNPTEIQTQPNSNVVVNAKSQTHEPSVLAFGTTTQPESPTVIQAQSEITLSAQTIQANPSIYQSNDWVHQSNGWIKPQVSFDIQKVQIPSRVDNQSQFQTNSIEASPAIFPSEDQNQTEDGSKVQATQFVSASTPQIQQQIDPTIQQDQFVLDSKTQSHHSASPSFTDNSPDQNSRISTESQSIKASDVSSHFSESQANSSEKLSAQHSSESLTADSSISLNHYNNQVEIQAQSDSNAIARSEFPDNESSKSSVVIPPIPTESASYSPIPSPSESDIRIQNPQIASQSNTWNQRYEPTGQSPTGISPQGVGNEPKEIQTQGEPVGSTLESSQLNNQLQPKISSEDSTQVPPQSSHWIQTQVDPIIQTAAQSDAQISSSVRSDSQDISKLDSQIKPAEAIQATENQIQPQSHSNAQNIQFSSSPDPQIHRQFSPNAPIDQTTSREIQFDSLANADTFSNPSDNSLDPATNASTELVTDFHGLPDNVESLVAPTEPSQVQLNPEIFISDAAIEATNQVEIQTQSDSNAVVHPKSQSDEPPLLNSGTISYSESPTLIQPELEPELRSNESTSVNQALQKQTVDSSDLALINLEVQQDSQAKDNSDILLETQLTSGLVDIPTTSLDASPETVQRLAISHTADAKSASESVTAASHSSDFALLSSDSQAQIASEEQVAPEESQTSDQSQPTVEIPVSLESQQTNIQARPSTTSSTVEPLTTTEALPPPASQMLTETQIGDQQGYESTEPVTGNSSPQGPQNHPKEIQAQLESESATQSNINFETITSAKPYSELPLLQAQPEGETIATSQVSSQPHSINSELKASLNSDQDDNRSTNFQLDSDVLVTPPDQIRRQEDESSQQVLSITPSPETGSEPIQAQAQPETRAVVSSSSASDALSQPDSDEITSTKTSVYIQAQPESELQIDSGLPTDAIARSHPSDSSTESQRSSSQPQSSANTAAIDTHIISEEPVHSGQQAGTVAQGRIQPRLDEMSQGEPESAIQLQPPSNSEPEQISGSDLIQRQPAIETNAASNQQISLQASVEQDQSATSQLGNQTGIQASVGQDQSVTSQLGSQVYASSQGSSDEAASQINSPVRSSFEKLNSPSQVSLDVLPNIESQLNPTIHSQPQTKTDQGAIENLTHSSHHNIQAQSDDQSISSSKFQANHQFLPNSDTVTSSQSSPQIQSKQESGLTIDSILPTNSPTLVPDDIQAQISSKAPIALEPQPNIQLQPSIETAQASISTSGDIQTQASSEVSAVSEPHTNIQLPISTQAVDSLATPKEPAALELTSSNQTPANTSNVEKASTVDLPDSSQIPTNLQTQLEPGSRIELELTVHSQSEPITLESASGYQTQAKTATNVKEASPVEPSSTPQMPASIQTQPELGAPIQPEFTVHSESEVSSGFAQHLSQSADQPFNQTKESSEELGSAESSIVQAQLDSELNISSNFNSELFTSNSLQPEPKSLNSELGFKAQEESKFKPQLNTPTDNIIRAKKSDNIDISSNPDRAVQAEFESKLVNETSPIIESSAIAGVSDRDTDFTTQISISHGGQQDTSSVPPLQLNSDVHQPKSEFLTVEASINLDHADASDLEVADTSIQRSQQSAPVDDIIYSPRADASDLEVADTSIQRSRQSAPVDDVTHSSEATSPQMNEVQLPQVWQDLTVLRPLIQPGVTQQSVVAPPSNSYAKVQPTAQSLMVTSTKLQRSPDAAIDLNRSQANHQVPDQWSSLADLVEQKLTSAPRSTLTPISPQQKHSDQRKTLSSRPTQPLSKSSHSAIQAQFIETSPVRVTRHQPPTPVIARQEEDELETKAPNSVDYLEAVAQAIYHRLRQRMRVEQERHGRDYLGRLPW